MLACVCPGGQHHRGAACGPGACAGYGRGGPAGARAEAERAAGPAVDRSSPDPVSTGVGRTRGRRAHPIRSDPDLALALAACRRRDGGAAPAPARPTAERTPIRIALDWTPNTNHTGLYVAQQEGWFAQAGLDVEFLPYNNTSPDTLVGSGAAEFGISFQDSFTSRRPPAPTPSR